MSEDLARETLRRTISEIAKSLGYDLVPAAG